MHEFPTFKFFSYFETVTFCFVTFRVENNVSFASKACVKKLLEFGSQVVTFRVYVTFYVNVTFCGVTAPHCPALINFFHNVNLCCSAFFQESYIFAEKVMTSTLLTFVYLAEFSIALAAGKLVKKLEPRTLYFIT